MDENSLSGLGTLLTIAGFLSFISGLFTGCTRKTMIISNLLFFIGVYIILGMQKFISFVTNKKRIPGTVIFSIGLLLIIFGRNYIGTLAEIIGIFLMFNGFLPRVMTFLRRLPYVGKYFRKIHLPAWMYDNDDTLPM